MLPKKDWVMHNANKKRAEFQLVALTILAHYGEMDAPALQDAIFQKLYGMNFRSHRVRFKHPILCTNFWSGFPGYMLKMRQASDVSIDYKRSPNPVRDKILKERKHVHYSITDNGRGKRVALTSQQAVVVETGKRRPIGDTSPGVGRSFILRPMNQSLG
jgi:hypothetical protein